KLVGNLASMSTSERIKAIQKMPGTMKKKREISLSEYFHLLQLGHKTLKIIGANFGTSVLSYFLFLKWLLTFNIFSFIINFSFITVPQFVAAEPNNLSFTGLELFTGAGYFQKTVLYYGFYSNATISKTENGPSYNMQLAYIFTTGIYFVICFFILLFSMAKSFCRNFINPQIHSGIASKLLCIWDFNITNEKAVKLKQKNISMQIKEDLAEENREVLNFSATQRVVRIVIHLVCWVASLGTAVAACAGVYFLSINNLKHKNDLESQAAMLVLPIVASLLNTFIPFFYSWLGHLERFQTPGHQIYLLLLFLFRNIILKISIVGILCYYWLNIVAVSESQDVICSDFYKEFYHLENSIVLCFFFSPPRIIGTIVCMNLGLPEFDIGRNVLDLIYAQTLTWIGILFSPLLPGIQMISFSIVFYVKKVSLMMNCQPPRKLWRTAHMTTSFMLLLFFPSFLGVLSVIGVTIWRLKPSEECGPFRGLSSMYDAVSEWIKILENYTTSKWVVWIYRNLITSELFFFSLSVVVLIITYLYWQIAEGRKTVAKLLQKQLMNGGKEKRLLLEKLWVLQRKPKNPSAPRGQGQQVSLIVQVLLFQLHAWYDFMGFL
uniref:Transmembrane channel-like protein n=1 Tax=Otus sunia TaxID=257818 RepID=A0A8C8A850_9STRI